MNDEPFEIDQIAHTGRHGSSQGIDGKIEVGESNERPKGLIDRSDQVTLVTIEFLEGSKAVVRIGNGAFVPIVAVEVELFWCGMGEMLA